MSTSAFGIDHGDVSKGLRPANVSALSRVASGGGRNSGMALGKVNSQRAGQLASRTSNPAMRQGLIGSGKSNKAGMSMSGATSPTQTTAGVRAGRRAGAPSRLP